MNVLKANIDNLVIEGFESDYVYKTIEKTQNFYECELLNKWSKYISYSQTMLDIGANLGNHSLYWATRIKPEKIYSFEPYLPTFERLKNNINNNNIKNVCIINKGVGEKKGFASIKNFDESNLGSTALQYEENNLVNEGIEIIDIDSFVAENDIKYVDFIKIDVEGFEVSVIKGMPELLKTSKPDLWIEVGVSTFHEIFDVLLPLGYVLVDVEGFNVFFLNKSRHNDLKKVEERKIFEKMFYFLDRTNTYYKNYLTAKQWTEDKNCLLEKNQDSYNSLKDKYSASLENYKNLKEKYNTSLENYKNLKEKYNTSLENYRKLEEKCNNLKMQFEKEKTIHINGLLENYSELDKEIVFIKELKMNIQRLETQNSYLKHENSEYRRKLSKITDTTIGKIGINTYKMLKRIKAKLK